jgi:hypothetical protein
MKLTDDRNQPFGAKQFSLMQSVNFERQQCGKA